MVKRQEEEVPQKKLQPPCNNLGNGVSWLRGPLIGRGGFGSVYLANSKKPKWHRFFPSIMAVKSAEYSVSGSIQKEKEVLSNLRECSNVLRCFGEETTTSENGEIVYNMMLEYASGGTLANLIKKSNCSGLPESDVRRFTRSILKGLNGIHDCGYVHCDLKPENILLVSRNCNANCNASSSNFVVKIGDFGLAKKADERKKRRLEPYLRGTALYLAPEAVADNVQEPSADIWALGCVVLEMLTGKPAWETDPGSSSKDLLRRIGYGHELPKIPSGISKEGKGFLKGCFVRKSMFRWTAEMLLDHPFVAGEEDGEEEQIAEIEEVLDIVAVSSVSLLIVTDDDDPSSSDYSDECNFTSEEDCSFGSWSEDTEDMNVKFIGNSNKNVAMGGQKSEKIQNSSILLPPSRPDFRGDNSKR